MTKLSHGNLFEALSRAILGVVQAAVTSTAAFCLISQRELVKRTTGWLALDGSIAPADDRQLALLLPQTMAEGSRESELELLDGHDRVLLISFDVPTMQVCAGVARHRSARSFEPAELRRLHDLIPAALQLAALHTQCLEHERRELVSRSLRSVTDACCVLDLDTRRVRWVHDLRHDQPCVSDIVGAEAHFAELVARVHDASGDRQVPSTATIGRTTIVRTVDLGRPDEFEGSRSLAVALAYADGEPTTLSTRERQIAQLLASGYSTVNAAAILSLSENTIRTYVRRLYRKLEITNRADLTRKCSELSLW